MRREVLVLLSNEKVTYIEFQDDLWVTFDPWLFIFQGGFWPFIFPKWLLEFLFSFNYNNLENMKTLHIPHFGFSYKIKYLQYFTIWQFSFLFPPKMFAPCFVLRQYPFLLRVEDMGFLDVKCYVAFSVLLHTC